MSTINTTNLKHPSSASNNIVLNADGSVTIPNNTRGLTLETAKAFNWNSLTTNTSIDFTSIPSWVKRITVMLDGVSLASFNSESNSIAIRLGTSSGIESTTYRQTSIYYGGNAATSAGTNRSDCFHAYVWYNNASTMQGSIVFTRITGNTWIGNGLFNLSDGLTVVTTGAKTLSGTLDRIRVTTVGGTDTFDAGSINILYE